ncbi:outer membrane beta-barrel protein [Chitinophaga nivalis]|uniref:TonB-dependent receptor n=1 Tax=Chitinophaga nivalis TaxID=2991709 RepID=A0ABT3IHC4_9BACT|nr:outer membrane beta-barrel protein [Chitinophaga nivalis]MCW3466941.1 TonB-dependent receptor [Chitinophaga nivalis]MCW3483368.1 TonB-dependent receptor [Chitinophaga nivalis]
MMHVMLATAQQRITGTVTDQQRQPVAFASIAITTAGKTIGQTFSDSTGVFLVKGKSGHAYQLSIAAIGYQPRLIPFVLHKDTSIQVVLETAVTSLGEVVISRRRPTIEQQADRTIFNVENNITAAGNNVMDLFSRIPGVKVSGNSVSVAGKGAVRVMINNRLVQLSGEDLARYLGSLSANDIAKIEVITHPPARYDAEGNAGLINIVLKRNRREGYTGSVQGVYKRGNFDHESLGGNLNYNHNNWSLYGNANLYNGRILEGFETSVFYPDRSWILSDTGDYKIRSANVSLGADYQLSPATTIGIGYMGGTVQVTGSDHVFNPLLNKGGQTDSVLRTYAVYNPVAFNHAINLHLVTNLDTVGRKLSIDADYFNFDRSDESDFESNSYSPGGVATPWGQALYYTTAQQRINIYTLKADLELPGRVANFTAGFKTSYINNYSNAFYDRILAKGRMFDSTRSNEFLYKEYTNALYVSAEKSLDKWNIMAGLRGEWTRTSGYSYMLQQQHDRDYLKLFPSLLVTYKPGNEQTWALAYNKRISRPDFWALNPYKSLTTAYSYFQGDPALQPEYNTNIELSHTARIFRTTAFLSITNNGFENVTIARPDTNLVYRTPLNFITTYRSGITETITLNPVSWLESTNQLTIYHTAAVSALPQIASLRAFSAYVSTSNNISLNRSGTLSAAVNFWCQFPEVQHVSKTNTYYKLDLGLRWLTWKKQLAVSLNGNDLLASSAPILYTTVDNLPQRYVNFQVYRSVSLTLNYKFGNSQLKVKKHTAGNEEERGRAH